jgi:hypothetical protein
MTDYIVINQPKIISLENRLVYKAKAARHAIMEYKQSLISN